MEGKKILGQKDFLGDGETESLMNEHGTLIEGRPVEILNNSMRRSMDWPPCGSSAWCDDQVLGGTPRGSAMDGGSAGTALNVAMLFTVPTRDRAHVYCFMDSAASCSIAHSIAQSGTG